MDRMIFLNLPVDDVAASRRFWTGLGFSVNEEFCDEGSTACIVVSDTIVLMLLERGRFADFTDKQIADTRTSTSVISCLSAASREEVDTLVGAALEHGATEGRAESEGPMYGRSFEDPDGHLWEVLFMEMAEVG